MYQQIGSFAPDLDPTTPGIMTALTNMVPTMRGYAGAASAQNVGLPAIASAVSGAAVCTKLDGTKRIFAGTATKLYEATTSTWTDQTRTTGGDYSASTTRWRFAQFGDDSLAVQKGDLIQRSSSGAFADISGAPKANCIATSNGFVMVADTVEGTFGDSPDRWWCCGAYNVTSWTPSTTTQATSGRLVDTPGKITGLLSLGANIIAYKDRSMYIASYVGAPSVWQFQNIPGDVGAPSQEAIVNIKTAHVFMGYEDFYMFDGSRPVPIGAEIRKWFFGYRLDPAYRYNVIGTHDRNAGCVWFFYPTSGSNGALTDAIIYNYRVNKWGAATQSIECALEYYSPSITYDGIGSLFSTWDSLPNVSYESPFWTSSTPLPAVIGTDHTVKSLSGAANASSMTIYDMGDDEAYTTATKVRLRHAVAPSVATMSHAKTDVQGNTFTVDQTSTEADGKFDVLSSARWHRLKFDFTGDHEELGVSVTYAGNGTF
jgi:hypothetical protein